MQSAFDVTNALDVTFGHTVQRVVDNICVIGSLLDPTMSFRRNFTLKSAKSVPIE